MSEHLSTNVILAIATPISLLLCLFLLYLYHYNHPFCKRLTRHVRKRCTDIASSLETGMIYGTETEGLITFSGGENLTVTNILEAPGEVVGKSGHSTLYRASVPVGPTGTNAVSVLLRFVRPGCAGKAEEIVPIVRMLGTIRHPNLVPLRALYVGPRGEKLFVHPFYAAGTLARFLREGVDETQKWDITCKISIGIARGLDHLHNGLPKLVIHGNLKANNILLDSNFQPRLADFGLHLLLNQTASQEMLESAASNGYKPPELMKMKDVCPKSDIFSFGVVLLEMLSPKEDSVRDGSVLASEELHVPTNFKDLVLERKISDAFGTEILTKNNSGANEERMQMLFRLATACCSPSPVLRPDIKGVLRQLEEICR
ncbi:Leucine-rich repeat protein kinase family protein [Rhynchospora pubera]|uniref:Leucine-rich repeat protein kinase family protein n=1 Tax=Rhynchospora pubera TaxID=906938 RepID=A0AAV8G8Z8_9POAL|nr:Leucine-rich repeat protein kinase family protein [Rhynchospora pubera]KAJ4799811.1 Leucine-rich repeat protein kinase family protein [Rhynchospora pubera]